MYRLSANLAFSFPRMNPAAAGCEPGICFLLLGYRFSVFFGGMDRQQRLLSLEPSCLLCIPSLVPRDKKRLCLQILRTLTRSFTFGHSSLCFWDLRETRLTNTFARFQPVMQGCSGRPEPPLQTRSPARKSSPLLLLSLLPGPPGTKCL